MSTEMLVLAFAFACEPGRGSEPGVGFAVARGLAELSQEGDHEVVLLTRPHRAQAVREALAAEFPAARITVRPVAIPSWVVAATGRERVRLAYLVWQAAAVATARRMLRGETRPVVAHHVTFASDVMPTFEEFLPSTVARVFGPAGSSQELNRALWDRRRRVTDALVRATLTRENMRGVTTLLAQNDQVAAAAEKLVPRVVTEPNIFLMPEEYAQVEPRERDPHRILCVGGLIERKQPALAIKALAHLPEEFSLVFLGRGPLDDELRQAAAAAGLGDRVDFQGELGHVDVLRELAGSRFLLHCSRQEGGPWGVGEAQAMGAWPVVLKGSGADTIVRLAGQGSVVPVGADDDQTAAALAKAIVDAADVPSDRSGRWDASRLPGLLRTWYAEALGDRASSVRP